MERSVHRAGTVRKVLLVCGMLASLLWVGTDIIAGMRWEGYSFIGQSISDLIAIGAPTRSLVVPLDLTYNALMIAFGVGIWRLAGRRRALRIVACMVVGNAIVTLVVSIFFPIRLGENISTPANTTNVVLMAIGMVCFLLAIGFGAVAFRRGFRFYSLGTLLAYLVLTVVGILLSSRTPVEQRVPTVGVQERTMVLGYLLWVVVLAVVLLRAEKRAGAPGGSDTARA